MALTLTPERIKISEVEMECYYCLLQAAALIESITSKTTVPICAKDITDILVKNLAFLSGGRGRDNDWIITFPENSNFKDVPEDVLTKLLTYLTSLPRQHEPDTKFILILDRRLDTWASVKITLQRIAIPLIMLSSDLYILSHPQEQQGSDTSDGINQLEKEEWVLWCGRDGRGESPERQDEIQKEFGKGLWPTCCCRMARCRRCLSRPRGGWKLRTHGLGALAMVSPQTALGRARRIPGQPREGRPGREPERRLLGGTTHLGEESCSEACGAWLAACTVLISRLGRRQGARAGLSPSSALDRRLRWPSRQGEASLPLPPKMRLEIGLKEVRKRLRGEWRTISRLLAQLHEMEVAFDEFWDKHQLKMDQYVQLWKFEQNFLELKDAIEFLMDQHAAIPSTGESVIDVKQRLSELRTLNEMAKELIGKAQLLILHGHQLAANHHYALDLICQRCNELRHQTDVLSEELKAKEKKLTKTLELQNRLHQALLCCDEGAYLLANQPMDKCQAKEGAQRALYDIEKFLDVTLPNLKYDPRVLQLEFEVILTPELKAQIQAVQVKLENIRSIFQNRQTCFRRLTDKHSRPIQLVAPRPEHAGRSKSPLFSPKHGMDFNSSLKFSFDLSLPGKKSRKNQNSRKIEVMHDYQEKRNSVQYIISDNEDNLNVLKSHVINELIETERVYVEELFTVLVGYREEMDNPGMIALMPPALRNRKDVLFGNMPEIYEFHNKIFLHSLESCLETPQRVGFCFLERRIDFQIYEKYCQNKPRSELLWRQCSESAFFQECQKKLEHKLGLDSYLLKPVQRLTKYQLLLKELLKYSAGCEGVQQLQEALIAMLDLLKSVNDSMHQTAITGYDGNLSDLGRVLMQGSFSVWISHRKGTTKMKDFARFKPMQRHLFLYEKAIVFCKRRDEHGDGHERTPFYSFKHYLKMSAIGITENVKGDNRKFEIWYSGREEVYIVQAQTMESKTAWLSEIRKILIKQQELIKVEMQQQNQAAEPIPIVPQLTEGMQQRVSISSEENESDRTSPVTLDNLALSPQTKTSKSSSRTSLTVELGENLEEWVSSSFLLACSDTEEEDGSQLVGEKSKQKKRRCHSGGQFTECNLGQ
ncbi:proto-oncogene DBL [Macrotis lagotis]|uniref:proto-oncogene DBL n=1 Tax=Macrotis lagotis TaxID=92651 RepID=UPI003D694F6C